MRDISLGFANDTSFFAKDLTQIYWTKRFKVISHLNKDVHFMKNLNYG